MGAGREFRFFAGTLLLAIAACSEAPEPSEPQHSEPMPYESVEIEFPAGFNGRIDCALTNIEKCGSINALIWEDDFTEALALFLGERRRAYLTHPDGKEGPDETAWLVADSMSAVLGGPPDKVGRVGPYYKFSACRAHSCDESGIAILTQEGGIAALGILHYWNEPGEEQERRCCGHDGDLDIYYRSVSDWDRLLPYLRGWGEGQVAKLFPRYEDSQQGLRQVSLFLVDAGAASN